MIGPLLVGSLTNEERLLVWMGRQGAAEERGGHWFRYLHKS